MAYVQGAGSVMALRRSRCEANRLAPGRLKWSRLSEQIFRIDKWSLAAGPDAAADVAGKSVSASRRIIHLCLNALLNDWVKGPTK